MPYQCWASVEDVGSTFKQYWVNVCWGAATKYTADPVLEEGWASIVDNLSAVKQQWAAHWRNIEPKLGG